MGLEEFWQERLPAGREEVPWEKVLRLLVVNRWIAPGSEFRVHRQWFVDSAMDELLGVDFAVAEKDRLYRCLDRLLAHKQDLFVWLRQQWADLFHADFEVLLYDLTSTYFEGEMEAQSESQTGLQPRWSAGLFAGRDRAGDHAGWLSVGLRGDGRQHVGSHDAARVSRQDRTHLRQGEADVGDGSRDPDRSDLGGDAGSGPARCPIWSARRKAKSPNTKEVARRCPGRRSATRWT